MSRYNFRFKYYPDAAAVARTPNIPMVLDVETVMEVLSAHADRLLRMSNLLRRLPRVNGDIYAYVLFSKKHCQLYDVVWRKTYEITRSDEEICGSKRYEVDDKGASDTVAGWKSISQFYERFRKALQRGSDKDDARHDVGDVEEDTGGEISIHSERRSIYSYPGLGVIRDEPMVRLPSDEDDFYRSFNDHRTFFWLLEAEFHRLPRQRRIGEFEFLRMD